MRILRKYELDTYNRDYSSCSTSSSYRRTLGLDKAMSEWIFPNDHDPSTFWPKNKRILCTDRQGWIVIVMATDEGFELDDGSEPGMFPAAWMDLPEAPSDWLD